METVKIIPGEMMVAWTKTAAAPEVKSDQIQGETTEDAEGPDTDRPFFL